jgi:hypothetical protein
MCELMIQKMINDKFDSSKHSDTRSSCFDLEYSFFLFVLCIHIKLR